MANDAVKVHSFSLSVLQFPLCPQSQGNQHLPANTACDPPDPYFLYIYGLGIKNEGGQPPASLSNQLAPPQDDHLLVVSPPRRRFRRTSQSRTILIAVVTPFKLGLHFILTVSHEAYGNSISRFLGINMTPSQKTHNAVPERYHRLVNNATFEPNRRANATIVMLARNDDIFGVAKSLKQMEDRFNKRFRYPYVLLSEEAFTDEFKQCVSFSTGRILPSSFSLLWSLDSQESD